LALALTFFDDVGLLMQGRKKPTSCQASREDLAGWSWIGEGGVTDPNGYLFKARSAL